MFSLTKGKEYTSLRLFNKVVYQKGNPQGIFDVNGFTFSIQGPGENTWMPHISLSNKGKHWHCGKFKGWTKIQTSEVLEPMEGEEFKAYEDEEVKFEFCRGVSTRTFPLGNIETEVAFIIRNAEFRGHPFTITSAPMYNKHGVYSHPVVFVKGIGAMVYMSRYGNQPEGE